MDKVICGWCGAECVAERVEDHECPKYDCTRCDGWGTNKMHIQERDRRINEVINILFTPAPYGTHGVNESGWWIDSSPTEHNIANAVDLAQKIIAAQDAAAQARTAGEVD